MLDDAPRRVRYAAYESVEAYGILPSNQFGGRNSEGIDRDVRREVHVAGPIQGALKYPATIYPGVGKDDTNYLSSEQEGTRNLKAEMNDLASRCPNTSVQLVGYSQGAQVIANVLQAPSGLSATAKANLRGVALFADPTYRAGEPWDAKGNGLFTRDKGAFNAWTGWSTTSATKVNLVHSYCLANDFFCQGGGSMDVHNSYRNRTDLLGAADTWLRSFLVSA